MAYVVYNKKNMANLSLNDVRNVLNDVQKLRFLTITTSQTVC